MIEAKYQNAVLQHRHGGNGWAVVQNLSTDYCRVVGVGLQGVGRQAFLALKKLLTPEIEIVVDGTEKQRRERKLTALAQTDLDDVRNQIDKGTLVVKSTHILAA